LIKRGPFTQFNKDENIDISVSIPSSFGGQEFTMTIDDDLMMYGDKDIIIKSFQKFLDLESNDYVKYTYLSHELVFHTSIELKGNLSKVYEKISQEIEKEEPNHIIGGVDFSESINQLNNL
jgi:hypothetical protein